MLATDFLDATWRELCLMHSQDDVAINRYWQDLSGQYRDGKRYYHNLEHIASVVKQLLSCKQIIDNWDAVLFAAFYHDVIYDTGRNDNEEQSAFFAVDRLRNIGVDEVVIHNCKEYIVATSNHDKSADSDCNIFVDADLSILGTPWNEYLQYSENIKKEYAHVPDALYRPGRSAVLMKFLEREQIFNSKFFFEKYERQAKENIRKELELLK
ncbi:MAG: hypothetical protein EOP56_06855 [Sphingobacteriales bacterium]|nr:MAG: hypothetical protein EOP56_06855 [Sphingobacteriales bacterium]